MVKVAIHQPNYFPWIGYFDKMIKCDRFILLDEVQLSDNDYMHRNRLLDINGNIKFITIPFEKKGYMNFKYKDIRINNGIEWQKRILAFLEGNYKKAPFYNEVMNLLVPINEKKYTYLFDAVLDSIELLMTTFEIKTHILFQSEMEYNNKAKKGDLVITLCKSCGADIYLSGIGAADYMNIEQFRNNHILVEFQEVNVLKYSQINTDNFMQGISILDMLFNCGVEKSKELFWLTQKEGVQI
ncbi:MAG: WbqC-like family protein [Anaerospora sp.]|jgi:hypothetical protein|nr:WbqC-like family protein [Anaerospora sp.]